MKRKRLSEDEMIATLREHEAGVPPSELCRKHGMSSGATTTTTARTRSSAG